MRHKFIEHIMMNEEKMSNLKAVIFDVDGTLANTEEAHRKAFNLCFKEFGLDWEWSVELYTQLLRVTGGKERMRHYMTDFRKETVSEEQYEEIKKMHLRKNEIYHQMIADKQVPLRTGIERIIKEIRDSDVALCIATTTSPENVTALLSNTLGTDSESWFDCIGSGDIVQHKKPAPDIYEWVLKELDIDVSQAIALEDSLNGIKSTTAIDLTTIVTPNNYTAHDTFDGAKLIVKNLGDPGKPCEKISGDINVPQYIDLAFLKAAL